MCLLGNAISNLKGVSLREFDESAFCLLEHDSIFAQTNLCCVVTKEGYELRGVDERVAQQGEGRTKAERRTRDDGGTRTREGKWKRNADADDIPSYSPKQIKVRLEHCKRCARGLGWAPGSGSESRISGPRDASTLLSSTSELELTFVSSFVRFHLVRITSVSSVFPARSWTSGSSHTFK